MNYIDDINKALAALDDMPETKKFYHTPEHNAKIGSANKGPVKPPVVRKTKGLPCTIDGVTIYPSLKELQAAIGYRKNQGAASPNFRYLVDGIDPGPPAPKPAPPLKGRKLNPCTVDGVTIYPNKLALCQALGFSSAGRDNPSFRYLPEEEAAEWRKANGCLRPRKGD